MAPIQLRDFADVYDKSFDYVVIGGSTSGLALATRLAEDPSGHPASDACGRSGLPAMHAKNFGKPDYD
ncbi:hypothetical protein FA95DRAFT_1608952 [Auriscalpium vulgare]|uniref:Uncharacterized protein n=1 Tax=Auriscalpium vulgare TaxID=40419 RepID=A0ACB8RII2_9AGAM|nr:hypothetical protein FA95DRAFT_1608952 [Auriscalpium vulgare]